MDKNASQPRALSAPALLAAFGLKPKKAKGQNFLADAATARSCVERAEIGPEDVVLEIGPGLGAITLPLSAAAKRVIAVELDAELAGVLDKQIQSAGIANVAILRQDILKTDLAAIAEQAGAPLVVMGNLPYNISSQILVRLIQNRRIIKKAVVMFQEELAQRIMAPPGGKDYGRISVLAQHTSFIRPLYSLHPSHFFPRPQVDSQVLEFAFKAPDNRVDEDLLFAVVKAAFGKRRKTLKNSLSSGEMDLSPQQAADALQAAGIDPKRRAETLSIEEFVTLTQWVSRARD